MSSYFGSSYQSGQIQLQFDRIYSSRTLMEQSAETDNIYLDRLVLIKYDDNVNKPRLGFLKSEELEDEEVILYADSSYQIPFTLTSNNEQIYGVSPNDIIYVYLNNIYHCYVCLHQASDNNIALFKKIVNLSEPDTALTDFQLNYLLDKNTYEDLPYDGYHLTVWRKVYKQDRESYEMIASLNAETPGFILQEEAPTPQPIAPHITPDSTNKMMKVHLQPSWGFKIKKGEKEKSDTQVKYQYSIYDPENDKIINKTETYNGDIYYNKAGFSSDYNNLKKNITSEVSLLPTGESGKKYYNHKTQRMEEQPDIQELKMHFPEIGNAVASLWNIIYGEGEEVSGKLKRNKEISWGNSTGLRMINVDPETGGYLYNTKNAETVAGCINSIHDLMGDSIENMVGQESSINIEQALVNRIYYGNFEDKTIENKPYNSFYIKDIKYEYTESDKPSVEKISIMADFIPGKYHYKQGNDYFLETNNFTLGTTYYDIDVGESLKNLIDTYQANKFYYQVGKDYLLEKSAEPVDNIIYYEIFSNKMEQITTSINSDGDLKLFYNPKNHEDYKDGDVNKGFFYKNENGVYIPINASFKYDASLDYYWVEGYEIEDKVEAKDNNIIPVYDINPNDIIKKVTFVEWDNNKDYYYKENNNYKYLDSKSKISDTVQYLAFTVESKIQVNGVFYKKNKYYYSKNNQDYYFGIESKKLNNVNYYELKSAQEMEVTFYEQNKYYYKDGDDYVLDSSPTMSMGSDDYYNYYPLYVIPDLSSSNVFIDGSLWNPNIPSNEAAKYNVVLGIRKEIWCWKELVDFSKDLNTLHGLILKVNSLFRANDFETRDRNTIQGCINTMNDLLNKVGSFKPNCFLYTDEYGRVKTLSLNDAKDILGIYQIIERIAVLESKI